ADDFGVGGGFFEGADKETGSFHSEFFQKRRRRSDRPKDENGGELDKGATKTSRTLRRPVKNP
ncbi:hypothetical protein, partial [Paraburkholderia sp.]|uniref:hypothetical protein n=1 Tax=Paraburkholderia sp. TaxID=1926495 RepID=UPI002636D2CF